MRKRIWLRVALAATIIAAALNARAEEGGYRGYAGSRSCVECHQRFYDLWSNSRHGLAMQPYSTTFAKAALTSQTGDVVIGKLKYRADLTRGVVTEKGPGGMKQYAIAHALGGKNVYYFLTPFPRGRLQTLPLAYDINRKVWFDTAASGVRHFPGAGRDQPVSWKDTGYTFNTGCYNCHVSQLSTNYDLKTDRYHTTWAEPGINCETCHGPSAEHNRVMKETPRGQLPKDMKIISVKKFTPDQHNAACSGCHAKMSPVTKAYAPGERFFDHYDVVTLENPDYYPDGRDLGENYTYTSWLMSPCAKGGKINCVTCHTSSGRYRFKAEEKANHACMPCHEDRVKNSVAHTRHKPDSTANKCVSCHMPMTSFARMNRTDHSMLPPTPSATIAFKSPNACNLCHTDKDAVWADKHVRQWRARDYQAPLVARAALIEGARHRDWKQLPAMLDYITGKDRDEVFAASLIRMIPWSGDARKAPALLGAMKDSSPLVRAAAADALQQAPSREAVQALVAATADEYRLVRVRAAASLTAYLKLPLDGASKQTVETAHKEYLASLTARPDQWSSHYNLGNYHLNRNELKQAVGAYDTALKLEPRAVLAMVNESMAYARMGEGKKADESLKRALKEAPDNAAANFNMGLLKAEQNDPKGAEKYLKKALDADPQMAQAAYNLCIITSKDRIAEAVRYCRKAADLRPQDPRYAFSLAFYLNQKGDRDEAARLLKAIIEKYPGYRDAEMLLGEISKNKKKPLGKHREWSSDMK
ncbi:MAG TPA: tetratricopeptide repeat protein [Syntrophorhabdaceae bacterium]|jgi:tetratricopeptide (TPR) repeat protein